MSSYAIVDVANLFSRARHAVKGDLEDRIGLTLQIGFRAIRRLHRVNGCTHVVLCMEGGSWRRDIYPMYKGKRRADRALRLADPKEKAEEEAFEAAMESFAEFFRKESRCTVLQEKTIEGDDFIARWIALHPDDQHIILTSDGDFVQLISDKVSIYNGITEVYLRENGVFDHDDKPLWFEVDPAKAAIRHSTFEDAKKKHDLKEKEKKAKKPLYETVDFSWEIEPEWTKKALFLKMVRGDTSDSVFSAYPGVRYNGSANKVGIREAWDDRTDKTWAWNQFMNATWMKNGEEVRVRDEMEMNRRLVDLTAHPQDILDLMDNAIVAEIQKEPVATVGLNFIRFCGKHNLPALRKEAPDHALYLNQSYRQ